IFKGCQKDTKYSKSTMLFQSEYPISGQTDSRITLPGPSADVSRFSCVAAKNPHPGAGILTGCPFE
ncbi:hypothetical protein L211DRAFT_753960, partial [Terfezia boudieri ATCC MYA-4762]